MRHWAAQGLSQKEAARQLGVETTGGSSGQPYMLDLGSGMVAMIGSKREMFPDGSRFEGVGIKPDIEILPSAGNDAPLDAARKL